MRPRFPSQAYNLETLRRSPVAEVSGSLGDLGTLLPLLIALTLGGSISLSTTLVFTGLANVVTGLLFSLPLPVQPMKAVAAVAISRSFSQTETASAGLFVAGVILFLSLSGLLEWVGKTVPIPIVKGIQVGAGLSLIISAGSNLLQTLGWTEPSWADNLTWAVVAFILLLTTIITPRVPYALMIFMAGIILSLAYHSSNSLHLPDTPLFGIWHPRVAVPTWADFKEGVLVAGLGQIPLTTLNSVIAVTHLAADLLPRVPTPSNTAIGLSVAMMNLIGCWFGAMPVCHGSGGLAAQYKFGARSGSSVILLGVFKIAIGLVISQSWLLELLRQFPKSFLGIMVIAAGIELAKVGESLNHGARDLWEEAESSLDAHNKISREPSELERRERWMVMLFTIAGLLAFKNDAVGFIAGLFCHYSIELSKWCSKRWQRHQASDSATAPLLGRGNLQDH